MLEEKVMVRVGGSLPIPSDARVLAATNQNLAEMVHEKRFREDLFFRLNIVTIDLPPLRERGGDILLLADHFLHDFCRRARRAPARTNRRRAEAAGRASLAGQCPRVAKPDGAAGLFEHRRRIEAEDWPSSCLPRREAAQSMTWVTAFPTRPSVFKRLHSPHHSSSLAAT